MTSLNYLYVYEFCNLHPLLPIKILIYIFIIFLAEKTEIPEP